MSLWKFVEDNWIAAAIAICGGLFVWVATNTLGKPLVKFWDDRQQALQTLEENWRVASSAREERIVQAQAALRTASATLATHSTSNGIAVRLYSRLRGYDLARASQLFRGVSNSIVEGSPGAVRMNTVDAARLMLGATGGMNRARQAELRRMLAEADEN